MKTGDAIAWFKTNFGPELQKVVAGTPFSVDMLTAIAYQKPGTSGQCSGKQLGLQKILEDRYHGENFFEYLRVAQTIGIGDGKSGHIVAMVPKTDDQKAKRDSDGLVTGPLQSLAGVTNFRHRATANAWSKGDQFSDNAFWIHA